MSAMEQSSLVTVAMRVLWNNHPWLLWQCECYGTIIPSYCGNECYGTIIPGYCGSESAMEQSSLVTILWQYESYVTMMTCYSGIMHALMMILSTTRCRYTNNNSTTISFRMHTLLRHWERFSVVFHQKLDHMISIPLSINIHAKWPHFYTHVHICLGHSQNLPLPVHTSLFRWVGQDEDSCIFSPSHLGF